MNIGRRGVDTLIPARSGKGPKTCDENSINDKNMNSSNARKYGRWLPWTTGMLAFAGLTGTLASTIVFWNVFFGKQQEDIPAFEDFPKTCIESSRPKMEILQPDPEEVVFIREKIRPLTSSIPERVPSESLRVILPGISGPAVFPGISGSGFIEALYLSGLACPPNRFPNVYSEDENFIYVWVKDDPLGGRILDKATLEYYAWATDAAGTFLVNRRKPKPSAVATENR